MPEKINHTHKNVLIVPSPPTHYQHRVVCWWAWHDYIPLLGQDVRFYSLMYQFCPRASLVWPSIVFGTSQEPKCECFHPSIHPSIYPSAVPLSLFHIFAANTIDAYHCMRHTGLHLQNALYLRYI